MSLRDKIATSNKSKSIVAGSVREETTAEQTGDAMNPAEAHCKEAARRAQQIVDEMGSKLAEMLAPIRSTTLTKKRRRRHQ